ncbi:MAG TPA: aminoglycoside phosphotransferase family protein [Mucilaginibacter sp.]|nr:aminoglycoside phosphotransferase family protein [Mucilaginibacter sp.]
MAFVRQWRSFQLLFGFAAAGFIQRHKMYAQNSRRRKDKHGNMLMAWWNGNGAAPVLRHDENAILMERAKNEQSLAQMAKNGKDDDASRIICSVIARLHTHPTPYPAYLVPLDVKFKSLGLADARQGGVFERCNQVADELLAAPQDIVALHGDIHHGNILDFGEKGWLAIDPKGMIGERGFDYANLFCNPDKETATAPGRLAQQVLIASDAAKIEPKRLLQWIAAWAGLSAAWAIEDGDDPVTAMYIAKAALNEINL